MRGKRVDNSMWQVSPWNLNGVHFSLNMPIGVQGPPLLKDAQEMMDAERKQDAFKRGSRAVEISKLKITVSNG